MSRPRRGLCCFKFQSKVVCFPFGPMWFWTLVVYEFNRHEHCVTSKHKRCPFKHQSSTSEQLIKFRIQINVPTWGVKTKICIYIYTSFVSAATLRLCFFHHMVAGVQFWWLLQPIWKGRQTFLVGDLWVQLEWITGSSLNFSLGMDVSVEGLEGHWVSTTVGSKWCDGLLVWNLWFILNSVFCLFV